MLSTPRGSNAAPGVSLADSVIPSALRFTPLWKGAGVLGDASPPGTANDEDTPEVSCAGKIALGAMPFLLRAVEANAGVVGAASPPNTTNLSTSGTSGKDGNAGVPGAGRGVPTARRPPGVGGGGPLGVWGCTIGVAGTATAGTGVVG